MAEPVLEIIDGPDKPALQWAVTYPERELVHFKLVGDGLDARIDRMDEHGDGFSFTLQGRIASGDHKGRAFTATYSVETRSGSIALGAPLGPAAT